MDSSQNRLSTGRGQGESRSWGGREVGALKDPIWASVTQRKEQIVAEGSSHEPSGPFSMLKQEGS